MTKEDLVKEVGFETFKKFEPCNTSLKGIQDFFVNLVKICAKRTPKRNFRTISNIKHELPTEAKTDDNNGFKE